MSKTEKKVGRIIRELNWLADMMEAGYELGDEEAAALARVAEIALVKIGAVQVDRDWPGVVEAMVVEAMALSKKRAPDAEDAARLARLNGLLLQSRAQDRTAELYQECVRAVRGD